MVEWGNYWSKAIKLRDYKNEEAYMGLFSQIGDLYKVKVRSEYEREDESDVVCCSAHLVLLQPGGSPGGPGGGVAAHPGPVAGDRGPHRAPRQEDELQGPQTPHHQSHTVDPATCPGCYQTICFEGVSSCLIGSPSDITLQSEIKRNTHVLIIFLDNKNHLG